MEAPRRRALLGLLLLALLPCRCLLPRAAAQAQPAADEARLLLRIKRAWGDPPVLAGWEWDASSPGAHHCAWPHVGCDAAGRVASLTLANADVAGPFPDAVGGLAGLTHLDVSNNSITGAFPAALYRCSALQYLDLSQNYLGGELPADIGFRLGANLTALVLSGNEFNGTIPASLSGLGNLQRLKLDNNRLVGAIPTELGKLTRLQTLWLAYNRFDAGELPASFKNLTNLTSLWATKCNLVGDFPRYVVDMPELEMLDLSINKLTGSIPPGVWNLKKLQALTPFRNNLTGDLVVDDDFADGLDNDRPLGEQPYRSHPGSLRALGEPHKIVPLQQQLLRRDTGEHRPVAVAVNIETLRQQVHRYAAAGTREALGLGLRRG